VSQVSTDGADAVQAAHRAAHEVRARTAEHLLAVRIGRLHSLTKEVNESARM
jgi:hypothetical protein